MSGTLVSPETAGQSDGIPSGFMSESMKKAAPAQARSRGNVKHRFAAMRAVAPLFTAMICRPGFSATTEEKAESILSMIACARKGGDEMAEIVGDDSDFFRHKMHEMASLLVAEKWRREGVADITGEVATFPPMLSSIPAKKMSEFVDWVDDRLVPENEDDVMVLVKLSVMKGMFPLSMKLSRWCFWKKDGNRTLAAIADGLSEVAANTARSMSGSAESHEKRLWAMQSAIDKVFSFADAHVEDIESEAKRERDAVLPQNKEGRMSVMKGWAQRDVAAMVVERTAKSISSFLMIADKFSVAAMDSMAEDSVSDDNCFVDGGAS